MYATQSQYWLQAKVVAAWKGPCATQAQNTTVLDMGSNLQSLIEEENKSL